MEYNFVKYTSSATDTLNTSYDYGSVMHYSRTAFSRNGLPTIEPIQSGVNIGQQLNLSTIDIQAVRRLYNCTASGITLPPVTPPNTGNSLSFEITLFLRLTKTNQIFCF
jgi:hypothetical protein